MSEAPPNPEAASAEMTSLAEVNRQWGELSAKEASPETQAALGEIRKQWHAWLRDHPGAETVDQDRILDGTFRLPEPIEFAGDVSAREPIMAYPALTASYAQRGVSHQAALKWEVVYYPFQEYADRIHAQTVGSIENIMDAFDVHGRMSVLLEEKRSEAANELGNASRLYEYDSLGTEDPPEPIQTLLDRMEDMLKLRKKLEEAATFLTSNPQHSIECSMALFEKLVPTPAEQRARQQVSSKSQGSQR